MREDVLRFGVLKITTPKKILEVFRLEVMCSSAFVCKMRVTAGR